MLPNKDVVSCASRLFNIVIVCDSCARNHRHKLVVCHGRYSTFTSYAPPPPPLPPTVVVLQPTTAAAVAPGATKVAEALPPLARGGQQCRLTLVDDVIADVRTLSNGGVGKDADAPHRDVTGDAVDAPVACGRTASADGRVCRRAVSKVEYTRRCHQRLYRMR